MHESSEHIRNRMLQTAARIWGYPEADGGAHFDPLVSLLLSVNAAELERLSNEIHHSRTRVLERIVQLMAPDVLTGPQPASAILYALSTDDHVQVNSYEQFFCTRRMPASAESGNPKNKEIFFTPAGTYHLNKCSVCYIATGNKLFKYTDTITKELLAYTLPGASLEPNTLWLAIDQPSVSLHKTQFFFQIRNEVNKAVFYNQLPGSSWSINGQPLLSTPGYNSTDPGLSSAGSEVSRLLQQKGPADRILQQVNLLYQHCFQTLSDEEGNTLQQLSLPASFQTAFNAPTLQTLAARELRWIKVVFPENISNQVLEDVSCFANCIPIVNRRLHDLTYRLKDLVNMIPLASGDQFFDVGEVTDEHGRLLHTRSEDQSATSGLQVLFRSGGAARFDERDAAAMIRNLLQLLRDEGAAFASMGRDLVAEEIRQLQQHINKLEQLLLQQRIAPGNTPYLMVRRKTESDAQHLFIKYWSTNGAYGNDLKAGTPLLPYRTGSLNHSGICLLTNSHGGKDTLTQADSAIAYRQAVLSKNRVMSREDIRLFCISYLGHRVKNISVEKGVMVAPDTVKGFAKTIDVIIEIPKKEYIDAIEKNEINFWKEQLSMQLSERSMAFTPFRIFIKEAA